MTVKKELRNRILLDTCVTPGTIIPATLGVSLLMLSVVLGSGVAFFGLMCFLGGVGALATNLLFRMPAVQQQALKEWQRKKQKQRDAELDGLDRKLSRTRETRDENALRNLRAIYTSFCKDYESGKVARTVPPAMLQKIDEIFEACVKELTETAHLHDQSKQVTGDLKKEIKKARKNLLDKIEELVELLVHAVNEVRAIKVESTKGELEELRQKFQSQLEVAIATEERVRELDNLGNPDPNRYAEYLQESE